MVVKFVVCRSICLVVLEIDRELDCLNIRNVKGFGFVWGVIVILGIVLLYIFVGV